VRDQLPGSPGDGGLGRAGSSSDLRKSVRRASPVFFGPGTPCEPGAPVPLPSDHFWGSGFEIEVCGIPHLAENERDAPSFLRAALEKTACAAFL
jgi:hypothetical protein